MGPSTEPCGILAVIGATLINELNINNYFFLYLVFGTE